MNLNLNNQLFIVGGASSGLGRAVAEALLNEGAKIIAIARGQEKLLTLQKQFPKQVTPLIADITKEETVAKILALLSGKKLHGLLVNAGGPPAMTVLETKPADWDSAYQTVLRWKVILVQALVPVMMENQYGRILFVESASVKQPIENLVLSNAFRLAVIGFMKTFSQEVATAGITLNALAPGYHDTAALERLINKKSAQTGLAKEEAKQVFIKDTKVGFLGTPEDFASLASWLLSANSRYITGQTISVDGGVIKGIMG